MKYIREKKNVHWSLGKKLIGTSCKTLSIWKDKWKYKTLLPNFESGFIPTSHLTVYYVTIFVFLEVGRPKLFFHSYKLKKQRERKNSDHYHKNLHNFCFARRSTEICVVDMLRKYWLPAICVNWIDNYNNPWNTAWSYLKIKNN